MDFPHRRHGVAKAVVVELQEIRTNPNNNEANDLPPPRVCLRVPFAVCFGPTIMGEIQGKGWTQSGRRQSLQHSEDFAAHFFRGRVLRIGFVAPHLIGWLHIEAIEEEA